MKVITLALSFVVYSSSFSLLAQESDAVQLSDWSAVISAVQEANSKGEGTINLESRVSLQVNEPLPVISSDIVINGNGAQLKAPEWYRDLLAKVESSGSLKMRGLHITGFNSQSIGGRGPALLENFGELELDGVTISHNFGHLAPTPSMLDNSGRVSMRNSTFSVNESTDAATVVNRGHMQVLNSTFSTNSAYVRSGITGHFISPWVTMVSLEGSRTVIGNSLFANTTLNCSFAGEIIDLGGNFDSDGTCAFDPLANVSEEPPRLGSFGNHGGLVPTVSLEPGSGAIDAGNNEICSATDARFANRPVSGSIHSGPKCDAGAFEYGGAFGNADLAVNGMNGLWFSHASDGHYVHVWRVSPDRVYINWTAFNQSADQMWIYAVADTVGESKFSAAAYINKGGQLVSGAAPEGSAANEWGSVEIELTSCTVGTFRYEANDGAISSGEFQIDRLAFVEGGGCSD